MQDPRNLQIFYHPLPSLRSFMTRVNIWEHDATKKDEDDGCHEKNNLNLRVIFLLNFYYLEGFRGDWILKQALGQILALFYGPDHVYDRRHRIFEVGAPVCEDRQTYLK